MRGSVDSVDSVAIICQVTFSVDHAVIFVKDLNEATADFQKIGFLVTPGGTHAGGLTKNALIPLADGTYLELLAFNIPETHRHLPHAEALMAIGGTTPMDHRFLPRGAQGEGFRDLALATVGLRDVVDNARAAGFEIEGPVPGRRVRPDGKEVSWELAFPKDPDLPFLIEDVTDRGLRVPSGDATRHPNGVIGISEIVVQSDQFERTVECYAELLRLDARTEGPKDGTTEGRRVQGQRDAGAQGHGGKGKNQTATFRLSDTVIAITTESESSLRLRTGSSGVMEVRERILNIEY